MPGYRMSITKQVLLSLLLVALVAGGWLLSQRPEFVFGPVEEAADASAPAGPGRGGGGPGGPPGLELQPCTPLQGVAPIVSNRSRLTTVLWTTVGGSKRH